MMQITSKIIYRLALVAIVAITILLALDAVKTPQQTNPQNNILISPSPASSKPKGDISAIEISSDAQLDFELTNNKGEKVGNIRIWHQPDANIDNDTPAPTIKPSRILELSKPDSGYYYLYVSSKVPSDYKINFFLFDNNAGENATFKQVQIVSVTSQKIIIYFDKQNSQNSKIIE